MNGKEGDKEEGKEKVGDSGAYKKIIFFLKTPRSDDVSWLQAAGGDLAAGKTNWVEGRLLKGS